MFMRFAIALLLRPCSKYSNASRSRSVRLNSPEICDHGANQEGLLSSRTPMYGRSEESIRRNPDAFLRGPSPSFGTGGTAWATDSFNFDGTSMATLIRYFLYERSESQISRGFL